MFPLGVLESHASEHLKMWWGIFRDHVKQQLPPQVWVCPKIYSRNSNVKHTFINFLPI